ncbi:MAG: dockerin type I domain-containing protein [Fimbriimonadales bacterium]|nr:dockerin type I domain-containing protein [Fimbriimonadales bacterium]
MRGLFHISCRALAAFGVYLGLTAFSHTQSITWVPSATLYYCADDGTAVGQTADARWFIYRPASRTTEFIQPPQGFRVFAVRGISQDGRVVVGSVAPLDREATRPFRWENRVMRLLTLPGNPIARACGVSADGQVVVGDARTGSGATLCRWVAGAQTGEFIQIAGEPFANAVGVSADGQTIAGVFDWFVSFLWRDGVVRTLFGITAEAIAADGQTLAGNGLSPRGTGFLVAQRWSVETGLMLLDTPLDYDVSQAFGISGDGNIVVGDLLRLDPDFFPRRWDAARWVGDAPVENLNQTYAELLVGSRLLRAYGISPSGRYIVGRGVRAGSFEGFLLDTWRAGDTNGDGCINDTDLLAVLLAFGTAGTPYGRYEDLNRDGIVNDADLLSVLFNFGSGC